MSRGFGVRTLLGRIAAVAGAQVGAQAATGAIFVLAARALGPADFGTAAVITSASMVAVVVIDAGLTSLLVLEIAGSRISLAKAIEVTRHKRYLAIVPLVGIATLARTLNTDLLPSILFGFAAWGLWEAQVANGLLRSQEEFKRSASGQLGSRLAAAAAAPLVFTYLSNAVLSFSLMVALMYWLEAIIDQALIKRPRRRCSSLRDNFSLQKEALPFGLTSLANVAQQLDTPIVALGAGTVQAGLYAAAGRLIGPLGFLGASLNSVAAPWLARAQVDYEARRREERRILKLGLFLALVPLFSAIFGPLVLPIVLGPAFTESGNVFAVLSIGIAVTTFVQAQAVVVQARRNQTYLAVAVAASLTIGLLATWLLSISQDAVGAAGGLIVTQLTMAATLGYRIITLRRSDAELSDRKSRIYGKRNHDIH